MICNGYTCKNPVYIYIVRCINGSFYTGYTTNIEQRIKQHKAGKGARHIKIYGFKEYTYLQCQDSSSGRRIELKIKKWKPERKAKMFKLYGIYQ